ncbi:MAG: hypothetical protein AAF585_19860 [Verrucomicrobiota bacterium]
MKCCITPIAILISFSSSAIAQSERVFEEWDKNGDGFLVREEVPEGPRQIFDRKDVNGDGKVSLDEHMDRAERPNPERRAESSAAAGAAFSILQKWEQEPEGLQRPVYVAEPRGERVDLVPVVIFFHGGGGNANRSLQNWARTFPDHLVVAPQGYLGFWNVQGERSKAPDVTFFKDLVSEIQKRYEYANLEDVTLIGTSNGAAYIYRLMIEVPENLFQKAVPMVSSLLVSQHHDGAFWKSAKQTDTDSLDVEAVPVNEGRRILYLHGSNDRVVPFEGGKRFGKFEHHSALATANIWAAHFGYSGNPKIPDDAKKVDEGLSRYDFAGAEFTFVAVEGGDHGLSPHRDAATELIKDFVVESR